MTWGLLGPEKLNTERRTRTLGLGAAVRAFNDLAVPGLGGVWFAKQLFIALLGIAAAEGARARGKRVTLQTTEGQEAVLELVRKELRIPGELTELEIKLPGSAGIRWRVDGVSRESKTLIEVYSRIGPLRGAQKKKIGHDILKLATIRRLHPDWKDATLVIAFASREAKESIGGWLQAAAEEWGVTLRDVDLEDDLRKKLISAQDRQKMVNVPLDVLPVLSDDD